MARSRSGTRNLRGPRKPQRRPESATATAVQTAEPVARGAVEIPHSITVKDLAELFGVNPADVIRELIKSGIFATINQLIDRDTASLVAGELGFEVAETSAPEQTEAKNGKEAPTPQATKEVLFEEDDPSLLQPRPPIVTVRRERDQQGRPKSRLP
jgi:translation initiation factor IF-2